MAETKRAIALGFFDGVHIGHGSLLERTKQRASGIGAMPSVLSFDVHPDNLVFNTEVPLINSPIGREEIIRRCYGIDNVVFIHFNKHVMCMPWQEFINSIDRRAQHRLGRRGHDFCFGYKGEGKAEKLKVYCEEHGIGCDIMPPVMLDGRIVSSTYPQAHCGRGHGGSGALSRPPAYAVGHCSFRLPHRQEARHADDKHAFSRGRHHTAPRRICREGLP
ncbi:MAG: hypothetical protein V8S87_07690 [Oscillospiraceae bacterium]